jgi:hypothetical protein
MIPSYLFCLMADNDALQIGEVVTTIPTVGFNVESVTYKNLNFNVWVQSLRARTSEENANS